MKLRFLSTIAAVALLSTSAMAQSVMDIAIDGAIVIDADVTATDTGTVTVAAEILAGQTQEIDLAVANPGARQIMYVPEIGMTTGSTITVTVVNGEFKKNATNELFLNIAGGLNVGRMTDVITSSATGYSVVKFQLTTDVSSGDPVVIAKTSGAFTDTPEIIVNADLSVGSKVTVQVTESRDDNAQSLNSPKTATEDIIEVVAGITTSLTKVTSIINVEEERKHFAELEGLPLGAMNSDTTSRADAIDVTVGTPNVGLVLNGADDYTLTIERDNCSGLDDVAGSITLNSASTAVDYNTTAECKWTFTGNFADAAGAAMLAGTLEAEILINTNDIVQTGDWKTSISIDSDDTAAGNILNPMTSVVSHNWKINGAQFIVPYLHTSDAYGTYVVVTNTSSTDAEVALDVYADKAIQGGQTQASLACSNVILAAIPANSTATYYPAQINAAIDGTAGCANFSTTNDRFMGKFSAVAPSNDIQAVAFQKDGVNGKRSIPVYKDSTSHDWNE